MVRNHNSASRRDVLKLAGGAVGAASVSGLAAAAPGAGKTVVNVGFESERGRGAAVDAASDVVREFDSIDVVTVEVPEQAAENLANAAGVRYVEENGTMEALGHYADDYPWGITRVDAGVAHDHGYTGAGADVAVVDTGIEPSHSDLQANVGNGACFTSCSGWGCETCWDDDNGHGTHVAGTVAAAQNDAGVIGVGHGITLHAVKVLSGYGGGSYSDIAAGIEWAADQGHDVINLSLGGGYSAAVHDAVQYADARGTLVVAAAGNDGPCSDCVSYPAAHSEAVAVSATTRYDDLASFSSTGPQVELAAPGQDVRSTYTGNSYNRLDGTSMASPHVAGAAAQLMAAGYSHTNARQRLRNTAENIGLSSNQQGYGLVDVGSALGVN